VNGILDLVLGGVVGLVLALTGAGGGILAVPALVFGAGLDTARAAPIALAAVGLSAGMGALIGLRAGIVRYRAALLAAACGAVCSPLGALAAQRIGNRALTFVFALVLAWVALRMLLPAPSRQALTPPCRCDGATGRLRWTARCGRALLATGALAGLCAGMLGVGGGFVLVPALRRTTDLAMASVVATSLAVIALVACAGVATSAAAGTLDWSVALPFSAGAAAGMLGGRTCIRRGDGSLQQRCFGWVALAVAVALALKAAR
jgi:uncharacterized membrane protein YfcA